MQIALYGVTANGNTIVELGSRMATDDEGAAMATPFFESADLDMGPAAYQARLRRIAQSVVISADNTVRVSAGVDGSIQSGSAESVALVTTDGPEQAIETFPAETGTRFRVRVEVTTYGGGLEFGEADLLLVPRRSTVNA